MSSGLAHTLWLPLLGLPLALHTNSQALADALGSGRPLGAWARLPAELVDAAPALQIDVVVGAAGERIGGMRLHRHGPLALAGDGPRLLLAQADRGYGLAFVPADPPEDGTSAVWELGMLLARARGRTPIRAAAVERDGRAVLLAGEDLAGLLRACAGHGMRPLAAGVVHVSAGAGGLAIWGDGAGGDLLCCAGPAALCLVERGAGRASQLAPLPDATAHGLGAATAAVRTAYRLLVGDDLAVAAALVEHVAGG